MGIKGHVIFTGIRRIDGGIVNPMETKEMMEARLEQAKAQQEAMQNNYLGWLEETERERDEQAKRTQALVEEFYKNKTEQQNNEDC